MRTAASARECAKWGVSDQAAERHQRIVDDSAARSGWSGAAAPRKASNSRWTARGSMSRTMQHDAGAMVVVGPARQPRERMKEMLHAVHHDGVSGISASFTMPLSRSRFGPCIERRSSMNMSNMRGRDRRVGGEREGADAIVVAVDVVRGLTVGR